MSNPLAHRRAAGLVAITLLRMGRRAEGEALWRDVEPLMQAQREQNVTDRYAAALAGHPWAAVP